MFGLKVFIKPAKKSPAVDGVKAVVHAVILKPDGTYRDPSPEINENNILFIPIPNMFSPCRQREIINCPLDFRLGSVIYNVEDPDFRNRVFELDECSELLFSTNVDEIRLARGDGTGGFRYETRW